MTDRREWTASVNGPAEFRFWKESNRALQLPASRQAFEELVAALGGRFYVPGEGDAKSLHAPKPLTKSPCTGSDRAIIVSFPSDKAGVMPRYVAFLDDQGMVSCVDRQFSSI